MFCLICTNIQTKSTDICFKKGWFLMILAKLYQNFLPNCKILVSQAQRTVFYSSPALNLHLKVFTKFHDFSCKNTKFSSFSGGHIPPQTPPCAPPNHPLRCRRRIYASTHLAHFNPVWHKKIHSYFWLSHIHSQSKIKFRRPNIKCSIQFYLWSDNS